MTEERIPERVEILVGTTIPILKDVETHAETHVETPIETLVETHIRNFKPTTISKGCAILID